MTRIIRQEDQCLNTDPFEGDFGDGEVCLSDKIVQAAKDHPTACNICGGPIHKGERHRALVEAWDGKVITHRFCPDCCNAMSDSWTDDGKAWEARVNLHRTPAEMWTA
jgi:hypothetical protein